MTSKRAIVALGVLVWCAVSVTAFAAENVAGIFAIGTSARALGLGGAYCALSDDEGAVFHNPAGLARLNGIGISSMFVQEFGGVAYGTAAVALPYVGFAAAFLDSGAIPTSSGTTRYSSQGISASLGFPFGPLGFGARWRFFRVSSPTSGRGWAIDPALLLDAEGVRIGLLYEGLLSAPVEYSSGPSEAFERSLTLGAALTLDPIDDVRWNASFQASRLFSASAALAFGLEAWIAGVGARIGFDGTGPTFGLSVQFTGLEIDWAYAGRTDLGDSHRVSLSLRF
jgi:hypothetical protein